MVGFTRKMTERIKEIEILVKEGKKMPEIRDYYLKNGWLDDKFYRTWASYKRGVVVQHTKPIQKFKVKTYLNEENECYFCENRKTIKHHFSYNPERIVYICLKCHSKIHVIQEAYHNGNLQKDIKIKTLERTLKIITDEIKSVTN